VTHSTADYLAMTTLTEVHIYLEVIEHV